MIWREAPAGNIEAEVHVGGDVLSVRSTFPPGSPQRPPTREELLRKIRDCLDGTTLDVDGIGWSSAGQVLRDYL